MIHYHGTPITPIAAWREATHITARVRAKHLGIKRSARPMPGSRASKWKQKLNGQVVLR